MIEIYFSVISPSSIKVVKLGCIWYLCTIGIVPFSMPIRWTEATWSVLSGTSQSIVFLSSKYTNFIHKENTVVWVGHSMK